MTEDEWRGGLAPHYDYMLPERPQDPAMRESASIWLYEENGDFGLTRVGIEAIAQVWDNHRVDMSAAFADGRVLMEMGGVHNSLSPIAADGKPRILGSGGLRMECIEPYHRWRVTYEGMPTDTSSEQMIAKTVDPARKAPFAFDAEITMVTPCWVQDNTPERLVGLSEREMDDARSMGLGYRMEHQFRATGTITVDGKTREFKGTGNRIHRQSVRPLEGFRGHVWQAAVFPDGRAFAYITYPPGEDGSTYNDGYVFENGKMYPAKATKVPWLRKMVAAGEDMSLELEYELGVAKITGIGRFNTFKHGMAEMPGFMLCQGGAKYIWDDQVSYGMTERSTWDTQVS